MLNSKRKSTCTKHLNDSKAFIEYPNYMDDIYKKSEEYNPNKKWKILVVFDDMIADMLTLIQYNKKFNTTVIRGRKLNISFFCSFKKH